MIPQRMDNLEQSLGRITMAPYIVKAMALIGVKRRGGSNMFRHQISTMGILLDYKIVDPVLLKAAVIHDLFEDAPTMPGVTEAEIAGIDADGPAVYALVMEVTPRVIGGVKEPKTEFLRRVMEEGSHRAKVLKLAGGTWRKRGPASCRSPKRSIPTCSKNYRTSSRAADGFCSKSTRPNHCRRGPVTLPAPE